MIELLLELYCEELPPSAQQIWESVIPSSVKSELNDVGIEFADLTVFSTPCRLGFVCNVRNSYESRKVSIKGPKCSMEPLVIEKFCNDYGVVIDQLYTKIINGQEYYYVDLNTTRKDIDEQLAMSLSKILYSVKWKKSMYWGNYDISWPRPIKNLMCILNENILEFKIGHLESNQNTFGHKFLDKNTIKVKNFQHYKSHLEKSFVTLFRKERKDKIVSQINSLDIEVFNNDSLMDEVIGLVEYPVVLVGNIPKKFAVLPKEILETSIAKHQKYFSTIGNNKEFGDKFVFVSNMSDNDKIIVTGNERVLHARLSDALYFYESDIKIDFSSRLEMLKGVAMYNNLGTLWDKIQRLYSVAQAVFPEDVDLHSAILICKNDLTTEIVNEFPELQGIMGYYYALNGGFNQNIASIVRDHYLPSGLNPNMPRVGFRLSLIDKLDALVGLIMSGAKCTGSKDPFGLRRLAISIIKIFDSTQIDISLENLIKILQSEYTKQLSLDDKSTQKVIKFIYEKLLQYIDFKYSERMLDLDNLHESLVKIDAMKNHSSYEYIFSLYDRIKKITQTNYNGDVRISNNFEQEIFDICNIGEGLLEKIRQDTGRNRYNELLKFYKDIGHVIERFFENVMINDPKHMNSRHALLSKLLGLFEFFFKIKN